MSRALGHEVVLYYMSTIYAVVHDKLFGMETVKGFSMNVAPCFIFKLRMINDENDVWYICKKARA